MVKCCECYYSNISDWYFDMKINSSQVQLRVYSNQPMGIERYPENSLPACPLPTMSFDFSKIVYKQSKDYSVVG